MFSDDQIRFLGNVIEQFNMYTGNSVNYVSFLHNYFEKVSSKDWPRKNEILELLSLHLPKLLRLITALAHVCLLWYYWSVVKKNSWQSCKLLALL